jgi:hypothetical protein
MRKMIAVVFGAAVGVGALFGYVASVSVATNAAWHPVVERPWCPAEDSCTPDYDGSTNSWVIHEGR